MIKYSMVRSFPQRFDYYFTFLSGSYSGKTLLFAVSLLSVICISSAGKPPVKTKIIKLQAVPALLKPTEFYVAGIVDDRNDRTSIGKLVLFGSNEQAETFIANLEGGCQQAINKFVNSSISQNAKLRPVVIRLKKLTIAENAANAGRIEGHVNLIISFELKRGDDTLHLLDYTGGVKYNRLVKQTEVIEPALSKSLQAAFKYFNNWISRNAGENEKLAKTLTISLTDFSGNSGDDTIYYSKSRPLKWNDFTGKIQRSKYAAVVAPGFGYDEEKEVVDGVIRIKMAVKVYVAKSGSWVKEGSRDTYSLNHEQRHFDLVKLVAERFKQKLHPGSLPIGNYDGIINFEYIESYREMNNLQKKYDEETRHGLDRVAQDRWNQYIDKELQMLPAGKNNLTSR